MKKGIVDCTNMNNLKKIVCILLVGICLFAFVACQGEQGKATESEALEGVAYYITLNDAKIQLGATADDIIDKLGEYQDRREIGDCGGLGAQVKYSYPSVEIYVLESKSEGSVIDQISFRDDLVSTPEGVYIGMTASEAKDILGEPTGENQNSFEYLSGKYLLKITHDGQVIKNIDYMTVTE